MKTRLHEHLRQVFFCCLGLLLPALLQAQPADSGEQEISADFPFSSHYVEVNGSRMHYIDEGEGDVVLFLHGNPTSSYLWRNIVPYVSDNYRAIAVDLIGMGKSGKPDIEYTFFDHERYLDGFIEALELTDVTLVLHDWGSGLGFHYASRYPDNVRALAFMEAIYRERPGMGELFERFRTPGVGEELLVTQNLFVEQVLPGSVIRDLTDEEMAYYRAPFIDPDSRTPVLQWPRQLPLNGEPEDVVAAVNAYQQWLIDSPQPKLLLVATPGALITQSDVAWLEQNLSKLSVVNIGAGRHFIQEDNPHAIGEALSAWLGSLEPVVSATTGLMDELFPEFADLLTDYLIEQQTDQGGLVSAFDYDQALVSADTLQLIDQQKKRLREFDIGGLEGRTESTAFWINAYNFFMMAKILEDRPGRQLVDSVWDYGGRYNPFRDSVFTQAQFDVGGRRYSLDDMEKSILLGDEFADKGWLDARIHFAVNCASVGCPPLRRELYRSEQLDDQLTQNTRLAFNTPYHLRVDGETVHLSSLFDWYAQDFADAAGDNLDFIRQYASEQITAALPENPTIRFIEYDWRLNRPANFREIGSQP